MKQGEVLDFWFAEPMRASWFNATRGIDRKIKEKFEALWELGVNGKLNHWQKTAEGALALVILLDQLPLNMFRDEARAYSTEQKAVAVAKAAIGKGLDKQLAGDHLAFLYMPLMHSEQMEDQRMSVRLFAAAGLEESARFARHHLDIIEKFGRFPHRNQALQRESTTEELKYLTSDGAFKG